MSRSRDDADHATGDQPTDTGRAERVAQIDGLVAALFGCARCADKAQWQEAQSGCADITRRAADLAKAIRREAEEAREGLGRRQAVHGKNPSDAEVG